VTRHALLKIVLDLLVRLAIRLNDKGSAVLTFGATWKALIRSRSFRALLARLPDRKRTHDLYSRTYLLIARHLKHFDGAANVQVPEPLDALIAGPESLIVIQVHDPFDRFSFLSSALADRKRCFTRVASRPMRYLETLRKLGIDRKYVHVIKDDVYSLVSLRAALKRKDIICCAVDYADLHGNRSYVNPAIINFASRFRIPVIFIKSRISDAGRPELLYQGPMVDPDPLKCAEEFVRFLSPRGTDKGDRAVKRYTVKRFNEHTNWKKRQLRLQPKGDADGRCARPRLHPSPDRT
jgi:hypothetical protein